MNQLIHAKNTVTRTIYAGVCSIVLFTISTAVWSETKENHDSARFAQQSMALALDNLSLKIDARIAKMKLLAKSVANDSHIHSWVQNGFTTSQEALLVSKLSFLVEEFGLTSASFADKNTHKYWNQEGFLRVLQPEIDTWYFSYLASQEQDLISVYHDKNKKRVDIYVNYQQPNGNGLSGIATSFDGVVDMLNATGFAEQGQIYLVDRSGKVQVNANSEIAGNVNLRDMFDSANVSSLLSSVDTQLLNVSATRILGASYIPSMDWYVVIAVTR